MTTRDKPEPTEWRDDLDSLAALAGEAQWVEEIDERLTSLIESQAKRIDELERENAAQAKRIAEQDKELLEQQSMEWESWARAWLDGSDRSAESAARVAYSAKAAAAGYSAARAAESANVDLRACALRAVQ